MDDCIFCKIASGEIKTEFVYEDDDFVAFKDINPKSPTHILVIPRRHISSLAEFSTPDNSFLGDIFLKTHEIASILNLGGYNLQVNVGKDGGQEVFHFHIHLMSKFSS